MSRLCPGGRIDVLSSAQGRCHLRPRPHRDIVCLGSAHLGDALHRDVAFPRRTQFVLPALGQPHCPGIGAHRRVGDRVGTQGRVLAREGAPGGGHQAGAAGAGPLVGDEAVGPGPVGRGRRAAEGRVVGATHGQEVRRGVARHHLARIGEDGRGEEAEGVNPWESKSGGSVCRLKCDIPVMTLWVA